jgi:ABC-type glycerol-3-phosphate transport system substrate-binding protein
VKNKKVLVGLATVAALLLSVAFFNLTSISAASKKVKGKTKPQVIRIIHYMGEQSKRDGLDAMIKEFQKTHPKVKFDIQPVSSAQYITVYKTRIAANDAPDLFFGKPRTLKEFAEGGYFMDISNASCLKNVLGILKEECTIDGKVYGLPIDAQVKGTFYNKSLFKKYGVKVPKTRDEFFAISDKFAAKGIKPFIFPFNFIHGVFHYLDAYFKPMAVARGESTIWADSQSGKKELKSSPVVKEALEMFSKLVSYKDKGDPAVDQPQAIQNFAAGKRPMYTNGGWMMGDVLAANPKGQFGMFPTPWSNNPAENKLWVGIDDVFIVSATTDKKALVLSFLNSMMSNKSAQLWMRHAKLMTSNRKASVKGADSFVQEIKSYIDSGNIVSSGKVDDYTAEYLTAFRTKLQYFVTLSGAERNVTQLIAEIDREIKSIRR